MGRLRKMDLKKTASIAGSVLMVASLFFIGMRFAEMWDDLNFQVFASAWTIVLLLFVVMGEGFNVLIVAENFRYLVKDLSKLVISRALVMKVYNNANMYKYIPGGFMYVVGRSQLAIEVDELSHTKVALSTVIEGVLWAVSALILSLIYASDFLIIYINQLELNFARAVWLVLGLVLLAAIFMVYRLRHRIKEKAKGLRVGIIIKRLLTMIFIVNFWGVSFLATVTILGQPFSLSLGVTIVGLYIMSWLIGFLTPGAPSGLGVREIVLLMFLGGIVNEDILISAIVIHRGLQVSGDLFAYGMAWCYARYARVKLKAELSE